MHFVGRDKEIRQIEEALGRGENVVVSGKYGIGRTSLIRHVAAMTQEGWRFVFVDFSQTPGKVCNDLLAELFPKQTKARYTRYKSSRFKVTTFDLEDERQHVLVLDNITRLTAPKRNFIRCLTLEKRFRLVAIVERFVPPAELFLLRNLLTPARFLALGYLSAHSTHAFFRRCAEHYRFAWTEDQVRLLAGETGGYPLSMKEAVLQELRRRQVQSSLRPAEAASAP